jgi:pseudouridine-5'-monophosphatase
VVRRENGCAFGAKGRSSRSFLRVTPPEDAPRKLDDTPAHSMALSSWASPATRAVLFDLDGVLLDTEPLYTEATQAVVGPFGKRFEWSLKRELIGTSEDNGARLVVERLELPISPEEYLKRRQPLLDRLFESCPAMPGMEALVGELSSRGVPMAVATSSAAALYAAKCAPHAWFRLFAAIVCGDDPRVRALKPAPDIFLAAADALGVSPATCVVVEDSPAGVLAARAAGMHVIAAPDPAVPDDYVTQAHQIVRSLEQLRAALTGWLTG